MMSADSQEPAAECICKGNLRNIVKSVQHLIGRQFKDENGVVWTFFGVVHGDDDFYYGMHSTKLLLLSCVGSFEGFGFELLASAT